MEHGRSHWIFQHHFWNAALLCPYSKFSFTMIPFHFDMQPYFKKTTINITHCSEKPPCEYVSSFRAKRFFAPLPCGPEQCLCILSASEGIKLAAVLAGKGRLWVSGIMLN